MADRLTTLFLQVGIVAAVLVALPYKLFELDRYFVPKELVLHVVALLVLLLVFARRRKIEFDLVDKLVALFLLWSAASALFATNYWLAQRALGLSVSSAVIFWAARKLDSPTAYRSILSAAALAAVCAGASSLLQAYGLDTEYFSTNRAPGGTLGNRNFVAHIAVIGLPSLVWFTVTARRSIAAFAGSIGVAVLSAALVLSRSRAAWLAVAACALLLLVPMLASRQYWSGGKVGGRFARLVLAAVVGALIAIVLPNTLNWNSDSPYLDSARGMIDYSRGSGRGRVAQYKNSLRMAAANPLFGVGPGNWPVEYVRFAPANDRSIADDGMTANPWPSSDWFAFLSERGLVPTLALLGVFAALFMRSLRRWRDLPDGDAVLAQLVLAGTIVMSMIVSALDVALLLAAPAFLFWSVVGATSGIRGEPLVGDPSSSRWRSLSATAILVVVTLSVARSATQVIAMERVGRGGRTSGWVSGAAWDPGSYRIDVRVAEYELRHGKCALARSYGRQAKRLFPHSPEATRLANAC
ncbi:MAG: O-antigen ligase family protein [Gemmatimonadaceae bacterium]